MKVIIKKVLLIIGLFISIESIACIGDTETMVVGSNEVSVPLKSKFEEMMSGLDFPTGCGIEWGHKQGNLTFKVISYYQSTSYDFGSAPMTSVVLGSDYENINIKQLILNLRNSGQWSNIYVDGMIKIRLTASGYFDNFWTSQSVNYKAHYDIKIPYVELNEFLCSSKSYVLNDFAISEPSGVFNQSISFVSGGGMSGLTQTANGSYYYEYLCDYDGENCFVPCYASIDPLKQAYFISTAHSAGPITSVSPSSQLSNYVFTDGGNLLWWGGGVLMNGTVGWFDPSIANVGVNLLSVRTKNGGCYSEWRDTVFYVTPIASSINVPTVSLPSAFGPGEDGILAGENILTPTFAGKFHFGCSDRAYTFNMVNAPQGGVNYEWKAVFQNYVYHTSVGNSFTVNMPNRVQVNRNVSSSPFSVQQIVSSGGQYSLGLIFGNGDDITNDGTYNQDDALLSFYAGDVMKVMVRGVNVLGQVSDWSSVLVGLVQSPEIVNNSVYCYDNNPVLNPVTPTMIYLDSINEQSVRSTIWDINLDGVFEYDGSVDGVLQNMTTFQKADLMVSRVVDSVKLYGYNVVNDAWYDYYYPGASTVCFSNIDTITMVRNPNYTTTFSELGTMGVGSVLLGVVDGLWLDEDNDTIDWQWSDGSMTYQGDSVWHYMNDLGYYSLNIEATDQYGCVSTNNFTDAWFVPGVLTITEEESVGVELYPVPTENNLTIVASSPIKEVVILDLNGRVMKTTSETKFDVTFLSEGTYLVVITTDSGVFTRKIMKL